MKHGASSTTSALSKHFPYDRATTQNHFTSVTRLRCSGTVSIYLVFVALCSLGPGVTQVSKVSRRNGVPRLRDSFSTPIIGVHHSPSLPQSISSPTACSVNNNILPGNFGSTGATTRTSTALRLRQFLIAARHRPWLAASHMQTKISVSLMLHRG